MQEILQKLSTALNAEPDIAFAYLFGSVAKGRSGPLSDVDVAVYFYLNGDARSRFERRLELMSKLSRVLQRDDVEVVSLYDAPLDLSFEILAYGKLIFSRANEQKTDFIFETLRKYHDAAPRRKFEWDVLRERIKNGTYGYPPRSNPHSPRQAS